MAQVKFILEAEDAKAVQAFLRVVQAQGKATSGAKAFGAATSAAANQGTASVEQLRKKLSEAERAEAQLAARALVARTRNATQGSADLNITQTGRAMARFGTNPIVGQQIAELQAARNAVAQQLRQQRAEAAKLRARESLDTGIRGLLTRGAALTGAAGGRQAAEAAARARAEQDRSNKLAVELKEIELEKQARDKATMSARMGALAMGAFAAAIGAVTAASENLNRERTGALGRMQTSVKSVGELKQIAGGDQTKLDSMMGDVGWLRKTLGIDEVQAAQTVFNMESAGIRGDATKQTLLRARQTGIDPANALRAFITARENYGNVGSLENVLDKMLAAAGPSAANLDTLTAAIGQSASPFKSIGGTFGQQAALLGVFSNAMKSPEQASELIKSVSNQLNKKAENIQWRAGEKPKTGLDLLDALPGLEKEGRLLDETGKATDIKHFFGELLAVNAVQLYHTNRDKIRGLEGDINRASGTLKSNAELFIPGQESALIGLRGDQEREMSGEKIEGTVEGYRAAIKSRRLAFWQARDKNMWQAESANQAWDNWTSYLGEGRTGLNAENIAAFLSEREQRDYFRIKSSEMTDRDLKSLVDGRVFAPGAGADEQKLIKIQQEEARAEQGRRAAAQRAEAEEKRTKTFSDAVDRFSKAVSKISGDEPMTAPPGLKPSVAAP